MYNCTGGPIIEFKVDKSLIMCNCAMIFMCNCSAPLCGSRSREGMWSPTCPPWSGGRIIIITIYITTTIVIIIISITIMYMCNIITITIHWLLCHGYWSGSRWSTSTNELGSSLIAWSCTGAISLKLPWQQDNTIVKTIKGKRKSLSCTLTSQGRCVWVRLHAGDHVDRGAKATPHAPLLYGQAWSVQASGQRDCGDNRPCQHHPSHGERLFPLQVNFISNHITFLGMIQHHKTSLIPPWTTYLCALCRYSIHHLITTSLYLKQHPT